MEPETQGKHYVKMKAQIGDASTSPKRPHVASEPPRSQERGVEQIFPQNFSHKQIFQHLDLGLLDSITVG